MCGSGTELVNGQCVPIRYQEPRGGGCLIATAVYGSELAPQVQVLREIRDGTLYETAAGTAFMEAFNQAYYAFSPQIADLELQSPELRAVTRAILAPLLYSLSVMSFAEPGSESDVVLLGSAAIALNLAMYGGLPVAAVVAGRRIVGRARSHA